MNSDKKAYNKSGNRNNNSYYTNIIHWLKYSVLPPCVGVITCKYVGEAETIVSCMDQLPPPVEDPNIAKQQLASFKEIQQQQETQRAELTVKASQNMHFHCNPNDVTAISLQVPNSMSSKQNSRTYQLIIPLNELKWNNSNSVDRHTSSHENSASSYIIIILFKQIVIGLKRVFMRLQSQSIDMNIHIPIDMIPNILLPGVDGVVGDMKVHVLCDVYNGVHSKHDIVVV